MRISKGQHNFNYQISDGFHTALTSCGQLTRLFYSLTSVFSLLQAGIPVF